MKTLLGIDLGSSSVKVALVEVESGRCVASASAPDSEAPIKALQSGWAEQRPDDWWNYFKTALGRAVTQSGIAASDIASIGISYQMHGLVCLDKDMRTLRDAIIWCDSRGVLYGEMALDELGRDWCLGHLLNPPGNFTATKLAWVKENEAELFERLRYVMLPGDWLAWRLSGEAATTASGLSEMMLWDYGNESTAQRVLDYFGFPHDILPPLVPTFGMQGKVSKATAEELGLREGIPITYRAGDQPNNALSLGVLNAGEVAATAGTSGVVYGILDPQRSHVADTRINTFLHVNHNLGLMHCISGCGILNAWMHRNVANGMTYDEMNRMAASVGVGSDGVSIIPFGNGAERVLENHDVGCSVHGLNFNRHGQAHMLRAAQEGVAFAFMYGMELMQGQGMTVDRIHAGNANMFLSPIFRETLSSVSGATIELYDTDGAVGAARGAGMGTGIYSDAKEAFASLKCVQVNEPTDSAACREAYGRWKELIKLKIEN